VDLDTIKVELKAILRDPTVEGRFDEWINESVTEIAYEFELPALRLTLPATLTTTTTDWQYLISTATPPVAGHTYMKNVFRVTNSEHLQGMRLSRDTQVIDLIDTDHDETADSVLRVAIEDQGDDAVVSIYPKANDTLNIWYWRNPVAMSAGTDTPDGIPVPFHRSVLISKVVLKAMRLYPELASEIASDNTRALQLWTSRLDTGLYGNGVGQIGMINALKKSHRPRQRRTFGGNLAGGDAFLTS
jgi:hypothetical protein